MLDDLEITFEKLTRLKLRSQSLTIFFVLLCRFLQYKISIRKHVTLLTCRFSKKKEGCKRKTFSGSLHQFSINQQFLFSTSYNETSRNENLGMQNILISKLTKIDKLLLKNLLNNIFHLVVH